MDAAGTIYGTTSGDFAQSGAGTVFSLSSAGDFSTLVVFDGTIGLRPTGTLHIDAAGTLYGTLSAGGLRGAGSVYSLARTGTLTTLVSFSDPSVPEPGSWLLIIIGFGLVGGAARSQRGLPGRPKRHRPRPSPEPSRGQSAAVAPAAISSLCRCLATAAMPAHLSVRSR
jgi:uncharacterized repeat protein (TIGR03803 family)